MSKTGASRLSFTRLYFTCAAVCQEAIIPTPLKLTLASICSCGRLPGGKKLVLTRVLSEKSTGWLVDRVTPVQLKSFRLNIFSWIVIMFREGQMFPKSEKGKSLVRIMMMFRSLAALLNDSRRTLRLIGWLIRHSSAVLLFLHNDRMKQQLLTELRCTYENCAISYFYCHF